MRVCWWVAALVSLLIVSGCDCGGNGGSGASGSSEESSEGTEETPEPEAPPEPRRVTFDTSDGVTIVGTLRASTVARAPAVILVHQLSSNRDEWAPIIERLSAAPALTTLAIDMRGHGESTASTEGELDWNAFDNEDWGALPEDVKGALRFLRERRDLSPSRIALAGSSIGSSAVVVAAAEDEDVAAVVALSPGRAYRGLDALTPLSSMGTRPLLAVAAEEEPPAAETAGIMAQVVAAGAVHIVSGSSAHGLSMLEDDPEVAGHIDAFLRGALAGPEQREGQGGAEPEPEPEGE